MKILFYAWNEVAYKDTAEVLSSMGHSVDVLIEEIKDYDYDERFTDIFEKQLRSKNYDVVFTWDYFPIISSISQKNGIIYISWIYDCPHDTVSSHTLINKCNYVFAMDLNMVNYYNSEGFNNVYHMPLATKIENNLASRKPKYNSNISFIGSLYSKSDFDSIKNIPDYIQGYIDALIQSQIHLFGFDLTDRIISDDIVEKIKNYISINDMEEYFVKDRDIIKDMIRKKITAYERTYYIENICKYHKLDLYTDSNFEKINNINLHGYVDYSGIKTIYHNSKINFNITLRSIQTGIPLRVFDIMGSNSFILTNYQPELSLYFENMKDIVWYDSLEDCLDKIDYFLKHDEERERIKENGYKKIKEQFSYEVKFNEIFDIVFGKGRK